MTDLAIHYLLLREHWKKTLSTMCKEKVFDRYCAVYYEQCKIIIAMLIIANNIAIELTLAIFS